MSRWRVYKDSENGKWRWAKWVAAPAHENWWEKPQGHRFPAWEIAVHYANRMARTAQPETIGHPTDPDALAKTLSELGYRRTTRRKHERNHYRWGVRSHI